MVTLANKQKTNLILIFHSHLHSSALKEPSQSEGIQQQIKFLNLFHKFKNIKGTFHFSGHLLENLDKKYPDFSQSIRSLLDNSQIELLSGGAYEPFFTLIPKEDRESQITTMNRLLNHKFGYNPHGAWITEHVWEPSLASVLAKTRISYLCLPKEYFTFTGINETDVSGYYITEDEGKKVAIFPITHSLNDLAKNYSVDESLSKLINKESHQKNKLSVISLDMSSIEIEMLDWVSKLLILLETKVDDIETALPSEYFQKTKPQGRIYLPHNQCIKPWSTPKKWDNSLLRYTEANLLHKKMLRVSKKINSAQEGKSRFKVIKTMISEAKDLLLLGQMYNCYSDDPINGIYIPETRESTYANLIKSENLIDTASRQTSKWIQLFENDFDCDGNDEIIIETETQNVYISPALGGSIIEHDLRLKLINIVNIISRREEPYHNNQDKAFEALKNGGLIYDDHLKANFIDRFLEAEPGLEQVISNQFKNLTKELMPMYTVEKIKAKEETGKVTLISNVLIREKDEIELRKQYGVRSGDSKLTAEYLLSNKSQEKVSFVFSVELNLNIGFIESKNSFLYLDGNPDKKTDNPNFSSAEEIKSINQLTFRSKEKAIDFILSFNKSCNIYRYPIKTIAYKYKKLQPIYQGMTILFSWNVDLDSTTPFELSIKQEIVDISGEM